MCDLQKSESLLGYIFYTVLHLFINFVPILGNFLGIDIEMPFMETPFFDAKFDCKNTFPSNGHVFYLPSQFPGFLFSLGFMGIDLKIKSSLFSRANVCIRPLSHAI